MVTLKTKSEECTEKLKEKGKKALKLNVAFFAVLFLGILLVPLTSLVTSAIVISIACVACLAYIHLS